MTPADIPPVLRDRVRSMLRPDQAATAANLAALVDAGGSGDRQVRRALAELEQRGHARRQAGHHQRDGKTPDTWTAAN